MSYSHASTTQSRELSLNVSATQGSIIWAAGNTLTRVHAVIAGNVRTLIIRSGGDTTIDPASSAGPANWAIELGLILPFDATTAAWYQVGQLVELSGYIYKMLLSYQAEPVIGGSDRWQQLSVPTNTDPTEGTGTGSSSGTGTLSTARYYLIDAYNGPDLSTGSSGQAFTKATTEADFGGSGYLILNAIDATEGTEAVATYYSTADDMVTRSIWLRVSGNVGDVVAACSHGTGAYGTATVTQTGWQWIKIDALALQYDPNFEVRGVTGGVLIDAVALIDVASSDVPTDRGGFRRT